MRPNLFGAPRLNHLSCCFASRCPEARLAPRLGVSPRRWRGIYEPAPGSARGFFAEGHTFFQIASNPCKIGPSRQRRPVWISGGSAPSPWSTGDFHRLAPASVDRSGRISSFGVTTRRPATRDSPPNDRENRHPWPPRPPRSPAHPPLGEAAKRARCID